jgi:hypothetical protein
MQFERSIQVAKTRSYFLVCSERQTSATPELLAVRWIRNGQLGLHRLVPILQSVCLFCPPKSNTPPCCQDWLRRRLLALLFGDWRAQCAFDHGTVAGTRFFSQFTCYDPLDSTDASLPTLFLFRSCPQDVTERTKVKSVLVKQLQLHLGEQFSCSQCSLR